MSEHSPGPWFVDLRENGGVVIRAQDDVKRPVAEIWYNGHDPKANGALVAAAPDMLKALVAAEKLLVRQNKTLGPTAPNNLCLSKIRSALAKATP